MIGFKRECSRELLTVKNKAIIALDMLEEVQSDLAIAEGWPSWEHICRAVGGWVEFTCLLLEMPVDKQQLFERELEPFLLEDWAFWVTSVLEYELRMQEPEGSVVVGGSMLKVAS